jgi:membrane-associated phospholipid phosphatase
MIPHGLRALTFTLTFLLSPRAWSAERDLTAPQPSSWYATHLGTAAGLSLLTAGAAAIWPKPNVARLTIAPGFERGTEQNLSSVSRRISDVTLAASWATPIATLASRQSGTTYGNSLIIYGETLSGTVLLNVLLKQMVLRARPYTNSRDPDAIAHSEAEGPDAFYSFHSGHSSIAFTGATAGSLLFAAGDRGRRAVALHWGVTLTLASLTAHSRVRAGQHYPTDVLVGSLLGASMGFVVPLLHQIDLELRPEDVVNGVVGIGLGAGLGFLLPNKTKERLESADVRLLPLPGGLHASVGGLF